MRFCGYVNEPWKSQGLRMLPVDNYCVLYIPDMKQKTTVRRKLLEFISNFMSNLLESFTPAQYSNPNRKKYVINYNTIWISAKVLKIIRD